MLLLLDTHVLLWAIADPGRIPAPARGRLESPDHEVLFSAASIWEVAIKHQFGRINLPIPPEHLAQAARDMRFVEAPVTALHAAGVSRLPEHHRDPFDRLLISQAMAMPATFLTVDRNLVAYSDLVELIR